MGDAAVVKELCDLLLTPPFEVIKSLCAVVDDLTVDCGAGLNPADLCDTILSLFSQQNMLQPLIHELVKSEVENTSTFLLFYDYARLIDNNRGRINFVSS